ncbi:MAG: glycosyltransferase family A protein [Longimicrobiales bacterium]|nr:glycosyltransferase family A protein [Longimicrobiales bacterium]
MANLPLVSVIIPTRDRAELLRGAVEAVLAQTHPELDVIIVDDGSGDHTPDVVAGFVADRRVRALRNEESAGAAAARNAGAEVARGEILLFEDDDCRGEPERVEKLIRALAPRTDAAYAFCHSRRVMASGDVVIKGDEGPWSIGTPAALIRAAAFREAGGFDPSLPRLQDFDLWTRLLVRRPAVEVPEVLYEAVWDDVGISASDKGLLEAEQYLYRKYDTDEMPASHLSAMHRRLGGKLMLAGHWGRGLTHFRRAVSACRWCPRSWAALVAGLAGPAVYRRVVGATRPSGAMGTA